MNKRQKMNTDTAHPLAGRTLYIPRMSTGGAMAMAAAFRSIGVDARISPESDARTLDLANRFTSGEECLPQRITLGDFLKVITEESFDPSKNAFFLPTSSGPCRFGQYASLLRKILKEMDLSDALVFSPTSSDGYDGIAAHSIRFKRTAWRALVASDILRKAALMIRPYEKEAHETDRVHETALGSICDVLSDGALGSGRQLEKMAGAMQEARRLFDGIALAHPLGSRPLIGMVGEIFLRFSRFGNQNLIRRIEAAGGEVWIADIAEWVWYTNAEEKRKLRDRKKRFSAAMLGVRVKEAIQRYDEHALLAPFRSLFASRPEVSVDGVLEYSRPYLPSHMALGEMTLNAGKAVAFHHAGCEGVVDVSPFSCMNGIVTETVYPKISGDLQHMPIRIFYFDGVPLDLESDLALFLSQCREYRELKRGSNQT